MYDQFNIRHSSRYFRNIPKMPLNSCDNSFTSMYRHCRPLHYKFMLCYFLTPCSHCTAYTVPYHGGVKIDCTRSNQKFCSLSFPAQSVSENIRHSQTNTVLPMAGSQEKQQHQSEKPLVLFLPTFSAPQQAPLNSRGTHKQNWKVRRWRCDPIPLSNLYL